MWNGKTITVIFPTYNEKDSIRAAIEEVFAAGFVDEVLVVNNNAAPGTSEEVAKTRAREIIEPRQGYGRAIRTGLKEATGDYLIVSEPDGTFCGRDVVKLLAYAGDFDYVLGTRTSREMIWEGANMGIFLKWGNVAVAKMTEFLFNSTILTDCGCTLRLIARPTYEKLRPYFSRAGSDFGLELTLLVVQHKVPFMEISVNYRRRVGVSSVTGSPWKAFKLGMRMIAMVLKFRLGLMGKKTASDEY